MKARYRKKCFKCQVPFLLFFFAFYTFLEFNKKFFSSNNFDMTIAFDIIWKIWRVKAFVSSTWQSIFNHLSNEKCSLSSPREREKENKIGINDLSYSTCVPSYYFDYRHYVYPSVIGLIDLISLDQIVARVSVCHEARLFID